MLSSSINGESPKRQRFGLSSLRGWGYPATMASVMLRLA
jgi:hypothetical protein